jgi:glycosyltransferase involved in cell wall biosynthesis
MKILIISQSAGSIKHGMVFRNYYFAKNFLELGHEVSICAASYSHVRNTNPDLKNGFYLFEKINNINYFWLKTFKHKGKSSSFIRVINMFVFLFQLFRFKKYIKETIKPDLIIVSTPEPICVFFKLFYKEKSVKFIYEIRDLWPLSLIELGAYSKLNPFVVLCQIAETYGCKSYNFVVSLFESSKSYLVSKGMDANKFIYIPNGVDIRSNSIIEPNCCDETQTYINKIISKSKEGYLNVCYLGTHGKANALEYLIQAFNILKNYNIFLFMFGEGPDKKALMDLARKLKIDNIMFLGFIKKEAVFQLLNNFDFLYLGWRNKALYKHGISPNKIFDYMLSAKPVIQSINTAFDIVSEANCGITVEAENPQAIADAIIKLKNMSKEERDILGQNGKKYVLDKHNYRTLAVKYIDIIREI